MTSRSPSVFIVDDDPSVRTAVARVIRSAGLRASLHASAREYLAGYDPQAPGCLVLDLVMPGDSGLDLQDKLVAAGGAPPIIFLTGCTEVSATVRAMKHGAVDFLSKPVDDRVLIEAVRHAVEKDLIERTRRSELAELRARLATLTPRELQVLRAVVTGKANKVIAAQSGIVEKTVKVHRARVMRKMQARSLAGLVQMAVRLGMY